MATMQDSIDVKMSDVAKSMSITVRVTGVRVFNLRMWFAIQILKLAAFVAPVDTFVEVEGP